MPTSQLDEFIEEVFGNILDLRECNKRLVEAMYVRQREQSPIIQKIGDVFVQAARSFRYAYPAYVARLPLAEKRFKEEIEANANLRLFLEVCGDIYAGCHRVFGLPWVCSVWLAGMFAPICEAARASTSRLEAFLVTTFRASPKVSSCSRSDHEGNDGG